MASRIQFMVFYHAFQVTGQSTSSWHPVSQPPATHAHREWIRDGRKVPGSGRPQATATQKGETKDEAAKRMDGWMEGRRREKNACS